MSTRQDAERQAIWLAALEVRKLLATAKQPRTVLGKMRPTMVAWHAAWQAISTYRDEMQRWEEEVPRGPDDGVQCAAERPVGGEHGMFGVLRCYLADHQDGPHYDTVEGVTWEADRLNSPGYILEAAFLEKRASGG